MAREHFISRFVKVKCLGVCNSVLCEKYLLAAYCWFGVNLEFLCRGSPMRENCYDSASSRSQRKLVFYDSQHGVTIVVDAWSLMIWSYPNESVLWCWSSYSIRISKEPLWCSSVYGALLLFSLSSVCLLSLLSANTLTSLETVDKSESSTLYLLNGSLVSRVLECISS